MREFINKYRFYILSFFAISLLTLAVYGQCIGFDIVFLDDDSLLADSLQKSIKLSNIKSVFTDSTFNLITDKFYRPFLSLSFFIDSFIGGGALWFYHYTNILIHIFAVGLALILFNSIGYSKKAALTASLIFAVHPALVPAVAWIPGRNDSLLAVFVFLSFILFIKTLDTGKKTYLLLSVSSFFAALLTKETAAVLPAALAAYEYVKYKKISFGRLLFFVIPIIVYFPIRYFIFADSVKNAAAYIFFNSFLSSFAVTAWYFGAAFFAGKIPLLAQFDITVSSLASGFLAMASIALFLFVFKKKINFKLIAFAFLWFIIFLIPSYVMPSNIHHIHRLYIPIFGILIISVEIFKAAYLQLSKFKNFFYILPAAAILLLSVMSYSQSRYYKDRETFWQKAYADNALSPIANAGMSGYYESAGDLDKAERYALAALELSDNKGTLLLNAGKIYYAKQDYEKAALYFIDAVTENKYLENAYLNLSALHLELGNKKNAHDILKKALVLVPQSKKIKKALTFFEAEKK